MIVIHEYRSDGDSSDGDLVVSTSSGGEARGGASSPTYSKLPASSSGGRTGLCVVHLVETNTDSARAFY